jgi:hypothetical protein
MTEEERPAVTEAKSREIFRDYSGKISEKFLTQWDIESATIQDINNMVVLMNWCFCLKNNFFSKEFNRRILRSISVAYNTIKSNILLNSEECTGLFHGVSIEGLKTLKFILNQYTAIYGSISADGYHNELCSKVSEDSVARCCALIKAEIASKG